MCPTGTRCRAWPGSAGRPDSERGHPACRQPRRRERSRRRVTRRAADVGVNPYVFDDDEAAADEVSDLVEECVGTLGRVDDDDGERQILTERQQPGGVDAGRGAEALDPAEHARAREAALMHAVHDLGVERLVMVPIRLADEDRDPPGCTLEPHWPPPMNRARIRPGRLAAIRPTFIPDHTATSPAAMLPSA